MAVVEHQSGSFIEHVGIDARTIEELDPVCKYGPLLARPGQLGARNIDPLIELQKRNKTTVPLHRVKSEVGDRAYGQYRSNDMTRPRPDF